MNSVAKITETASTFREVHADLSALFPGDGLDALGEVPPAAVLAEVALANLVQITILVELVLDEIAQGTRLAVAPSPPSTSPSFSIITALPATSSAAVTSATLQFSKVNTIGLGGVLPVVPDSGVRARILWNNNVRLVVGGS